LFGKQFIINAARQGSLRLITSLPAPL